MPKLTIQPAEAIPEGKPITDFRVGDYVRCVKSVHDLFGDVYLVGFEKALNVETGGYVNTRNNSDSELYEKLAVEEVILKLKS